MRKSNFRIDMRTIYFTYRKENTNDTNTSFYIHKYIISYNICRRIFYIHNLLSFHSSLILSRALVLRAKLKKITIVKTQIVIIHSMREKQFYFSWKIMLLQTTILNFIFRWIEYLNLYWNMAHLNNELRKLTNVVGSSKINLTNFKNFYDRHRKIISTDSPRVTESKHWSINLKFYKIA